MTAYILPFAAYVIISLIANLFPNGNPYSYPLKILLVAFILYFFRKTYSELFENIESKSIIRSVIIGIVAFIIWIVPEGLYPYLGHSEFNPENIEFAVLKYALIAFRILGAVIVVPLFEELFWRSFLVRWIISFEFKKVPLGYFTPFSFIIISLLFGIEHHRWLVGIFAGILYNWLLFRERNLLSCIIAHAVTNLLLAAYVVVTSQWGFW